MEQQLATGQTTQTVRDNHGNTQAIICLLSTDPQSGQPTYLGSVFGIAVLTDSGWKNVADAAFP